MSKLRRTTPGSWLTVAGGGGGAGTRLLEQLLLPRMRTTALLPALLAAPDALHCVLAVSRQSLRLTGRGGAVVLLPCVRRALHVGCHFVKTRQANSRE